MLGNPPQAFLDAALDHAHGEHGADSLRGVLCKKDNSAIGGNDYFRGGPPYFWELYEGAPISGATLQILRKSWTPASCSARRSSRRPPGSRWPATGPIRIGARPPW